MRILRLKVNICFKFNTYSIYLPFYLCGFIAVFVQAIFA
jgi:hypothetical protein